MKLIERVCLTVLLMSIWTFAVAQKVGATPSSSPAVNADPEAQYKSCPEGYYSGPRPGRVRYTKDEYIWVVTPEFAAAYCMLPEFVDKSLKGAEAIAYKLMYEGYENCGFGGQKEVCSRAMSHGFEIYYKSSLKLPSVSDRQVDKAGRAAFDQLLDKALPQLRR